MIAMIHNIDQASSSSQANPNACRICRQTRYANDGTLLLTNDGDLAHKLTSSSSRAPRKFLVKIWKRPDVRKMQILKKGVFLDDGKTQPLKLRIIEETESQNIWMEVLVTESRHRLLKRLCEQIGHPVSKLSASTLPPSPLES